MNAKAFIEGKNGLGNTKVIDEKNGFYLSMETTRGHKEYAIHHESEITVDMVENSDKLDYIKNTFDVISAKPTFLVIKEDAVGYPNNQSVVAFSPKEEAQEGYIIYYEISASANTLERRTAIKAFAENCHTPEDTLKTHELKEMLNTQYRNLEFGSIFL